ncbi:MAG TPA: hypothetical protein VH593_06595 [Ktedonobacteraceae bacterium]|jgi:hypothetical protein
MRPAWEYKVEFSERGKCIKREYSIGPIVPWMIVALTALAIGAYLGVLPIGPWDLFKPWR